MSNLYQNSVFFIEIDKIKPNPFQPRREFEETKLKDLSDSIRQYGVLQPLVVSRTEVEKEDGGIATEYELIAGERRLRASKLAGLREVPAIIRVGDDNMMKLELAIIENLQREDLNPVERARAFQKLADEFDFTHEQIGQKMGKSRVFVSNTLRILMLPDEILNALSAGKINEGHTRPLMMLQDRPEEQTVLFKEILYKKITVREAERMARKIAIEKVRKVELLPDPEILEMEELFQEALGTRVHIEKNEKGGQILIDFFSPDDLRTLLDSLNKSGASMNNPNALLERHDEKVKAMAPEEVPVVSDDVEALDDRSEEEKDKDDDTDLYNIKNFSL
ncbi:MAG: ParB/RepB/Spo0J family partition protein [Candidatus Pacebacteria bacterium]|nr:ParB/RepB/Spo0J family partition protein [Candidatus Paceibacterota bacterium]MBP9780294.1 ParB/RepB/Spo0J family partition protein [Candidatus Paceibacterota bacterium]